MPSISIELEGFNIKEALLDHGACFSILPGRLYDQYDFGPLKETTIKVVLANGQTSQPRGMLMDMIVKIKGSMYPIDFLVIDDDPDPPDTSPLIILGRPFLATIKAKINCLDGTVKIMDVNSREVNLDFYNDNSNPCVEFVEKVDSKGESKYEEKRNPPMTIWGGNGEWDPHIEPGSVSHGFPA
jgi:hypothetical protein